LTRIKFDYAERVAWNRFINATGTDYANHSTYIDAINIYLRQTKHEELSDVWVYQTSTYDKVFLTYYYVKNDSYKKLEHMQAIEQIMKEHYHLVDFEEFDGNHVRLEMISDD
jgi:hypothetical protein